MNKPAIMRLADRALNPLIGKSIVIYAAKPIAGAADADDGADRSGARGTRAAEPAQPEAAHAAA
jgi:hypothetical protein